MRAPLDVAGEVQVLVADQTVRVTAIKNTITVDIPTLRVGMVALRGVGRRKQRATMISRLGAALHFADLSVQFRVAGGTIATLGAGARPGLLSRLLGVAPLQITWSGVGSLLRSLWR